MSIVVLDGYTLNPGDLSWESLKAVGPCTIYDRTPPELVVERAKEATILLTNKVVLSASIIEQLPNLKYIGVLATGYNVVDVEAAKRAHIPVTNIPAYGTRSVAQMVFAHILTLAHHVEQHAHGIRQGKWSESQDFCYWDTPQIELYGLTLGIVGFGRIGQDVARLGQAFGMKVLAYKPSASLPHTEQDVTFTSLEKLFSDSDIVSLHCPLHEGNRKFVNASLLAKMKRSAFLINTGRGPLIDEEALADALNRGVIAGAGLDVLSQEPPTRDNPLLKAERCFITPHIAWATLAARKRLLTIAVDNIRSFLKGEPKNWVS